MSSVCIVVLCTDLNSDRVLNNDRPTRLKQEVPCLSRNKAEEGGALSLSDSALATLGSLCLLDNTASARAGGALSVRSSSKVMLSESTLGPNSQPWILVNKSAIGLNQSLLLNSSSPYALQNSACSTINTAVQQNTSEEAIVAMQLSAKSSAVSCRSEPK